MEIINKKTTELTETEKIQICDCFGKVFEKHSKSLEEFNNQFLNTCLGYSLHTMLKNDEGEVVGLYAVIPFDYICKGEKRLFCVGVDFMIRKDYRNDFKNVFGICNGSLKYAKENGISCIFGFPNDLFYQLSTRILRMKDIGRLYTYLLPYKVGEAKPSWKILNVFSMLFSRLMLGVSRLDLRSKTYEAVIHRDRSTFDKLRYKWFRPEEYRLFKDEQMTCSWKIADFEGVRAAFLMDVYPMSVRNFNIAVQKMFESEKENVGLFIYVGNLPFTPISMIRIPLKFAPKNFNFVVQVLDNQSVDSATLYHIDNWEINLSSYDLL